MLKDSYQVLDFFYLLEIISNYAESPLGKDYCLSLRPLNKLEEIRERHALLAELREFLEVKGWVSLNEEIVPVDSYLRKSEIEGLCLTCEEILKIKKVLDSVLRIKKFVISEGREYKRLYKLAQSIPNLNPLLDLLNRSISDTGKIKDLASVKLKIIREKKAHFRNYIQKKLEKTLQSFGIKDFHISIRDGRYVVGLSSNKKGKIKGIFHGYSHSKATSFIEPAEIVEDNNYIAELEAEEKEEEARILLFITQEIAKEKERIELAQSLLKKIDGIYAQAKFCNLISCTAPEICEEDVVEINGCRNPLLAYFSLKDGGRCVPIDLKLNKEKNVLIISGPNRGGKTVALKTLGLICLMSQTGLHIPAQEGSRLRIFKNIIAEIGDEQDLRSGMSTFSAHLQHLKEVIDKADKDTLVIIDEPGMGTDPLEGAAMSMAILDYLIEKGSFVAISTHLNSLKLYGINNEKVMNASVEFDFENSIPLYRLKYGAPGVSMGFEIAKQMGIPESILLKARKYLEDKEFQINRSIAKLNALISSLNDKEEELNKIKARYESLYKEIADERERIIESAKIEAESLINKARAELKEAIKKLKKRDANSYEVIKKVSDITTKLMEKFRSSEVEDKGTFELKEGQHIYHKGLKKEGVVLSFDPRKKGASVLFGNVKLWVKLKDIEVLEYESSKDQEHTVLQPSEDNKDVLMPEINLIGYRVDEALSVIDKAIDRAILSGSPGFKIIHGIGTGKLRKAVREYLKNLPQIKSIKKDESNPGGDAVTIVELK